MSTHRLCTCLLFSGLAALCGCARGPFTDTMRLSENESQAIDALVEPILPSYHYLNVAVVRDHQIVLNRSYLQNRLQEAEDYASVSKPVTAMLIFQFMEQGLIEDLDDPFLRYTPDLDRIVPEEFTHRPITLRHLLSHQSGIRHLGDTWQEGELNLAFEPGTAYSYSTDAFGILGLVLEALSGQAYGDLVYTRIGKPVGAHSFGALHHFLAPGGNVHSTTEDMARFAAGVMTNAYITEATFARILAEGGITNRHGLVNLGWFYRNLGTPDFALFHTGSNGRPRAFLRLLPEPGMAIAITGLTKSARAPFDLETLGRAILDLLRPPSSERLPETDIELETRIDLLPGVQGKRKIGAKRTERCMITNTKTRAPEELVVQLRGIPLVS